MVATTDRAGKVRDERELAQEARQVAEAMLGAGSLIARSLPGYQPREPQIQAAAMIWRAIREGRHAIIEAGTGTGKSLAALLMVIVYLIKSRQKRKENDPPVRIAIITAMKNLQDQYRLKDLPFLQKVVGGFTFGTQKGKQSYLCLEVFGQHRQHNKGEVWAQICEWAEQTATGDLSELPVDIASPRLRSLLRAVSTSSEGCPGTSNCHYGSRCWAAKAKVAGVNVDILVLNYHLVVLNALTGGRLLPEFDFLICDEAHKLEEITRSSLEQKLTERGISTRVKAARDAGLLTDFAARRVVSAADEFLSRISREFGYFPGVGRRAVVLAEVSESTRNAAEALCEALGAAEMQIAEGADSDSEAPSIHTRKFAALREALSGGGADVLFVERTELDGDLSLHSSPLDVSGFIRSQILSTPAVLMSATLSTGGEDPFKHFRQRVGLESSDLELQVASPYCYRTQARYLVARYASGITKPPEGRDEEERARLWCDQITGPTMGLLRLTDARGLVLCTSTAVMVELHRRISSLAPDHWHCQIQGEDSKAAIVDRMRSHPNCVTFATKSFFEGVDVPGVTLSNVIIERIPFPQIGDPVVAGLRRAYGGEGKEAFYRYDIPEAILHLRQGVGRLLRDILDRGIIGLLDPRFMKASYGSRLLKALPGFTSPLPSSEFHKIAGWIAGTGPAPLYQEVA